MACGPDAAVHKKQLPQHSLAQAPAWQPEGGFAAIAVDPTNEALTEVAARVFGFAGFRGLQLPIIQRVLAGRSTLAIMPTGTRSCVHKDSISFLRARLPTGMHAQ